MHQLLYFGSICESIYCSSPQDIHLLSWHNEAFVNTILTEQKIGVEELNESKNHVIYRKAGVDLNAS